MREWMKRIVSLLCGILICILSVCSFSFETEAAHVDVLENVFCMPYEEPDRNEDSGYVNIFMQNNNTSNYTVRSYYWSITGSSDNTEVWMDVKMWSSTSCISFIPSGEASWSLYEVRNSTGACNQLLSNVTDSSYMVDLSSTYTLKGIQGYGNIESTYPAANSTNFTVLWGDDAVQYEQMLELINALDDLNTATGGVNTNLTTLISKVNSIYTSVDTVETKLQNIYTLVSTNFSTIITELKDQGLTLDSIDEWSGIINTNINYCGVMLNKIYELLLETAGNPESIPEPPTDEFNAYSAAEDELLIGEDLSSSLTDAEVDIDASSSGLVWYIVNSFINANPIIISLITVICALGLVALILGR